VNGTLVKDKFGLFQKKEHSVNYLESHDGYTLGDFIRIGLGDVKETDVINDIEKHTRLTQLQMKLNKLAALFLFTSQGITMIHEGQEFARSKVIYNEPGVHDKNKGRIDHNSYEKDNETNYINYDHALLNKELLDYYKGLILLRKKYSAFRRADYEQIDFINSDSPFSLCCSIKHDKEEFLILFNADLKLTSHFNLPKGNWEVLVNETDAGTEVLGKIKDKIELNPSTGYLLKKSF
jgi:pullulanase/glycogen debranching enzyme